MHSVHVKTLKKYESKKSESRVRDRASFKYTICSLFTVHGGVVLSLIHCFHSLSFSSTAVMTVSFAKATKQTLN